MHDSFNASTPAAPLWPLCLSPWPCYHMIANEGVTMAQLLVRDVPPDVVEALKRRAAEHGRSAEAEHRLILEAALRAGRSGFWERAAALRERTRGRISGESADLIRQDRDER
jgi:plasmid stability protein